MVAWQGQGQGQGRCPRLGLGVSDGGQGVGQLVVAVVIMARINLPITLVIFLPLLSIIILSRLALGEQRQ